MSEANRPMLDDNQRKAVVSAYEALKPFRAMFGNPSQDLSAEPNYEDFRAMARLIDISTPTEVLSDRPFFGPWIVLAKRLAMRFARPLIKVLLRRQIEFNEHVYHALLSIEVLGKRVEALENEVRRLKGGADS